MVYRSFFHLFPLRVYWVDILFAMLYLFIQVGLSSILLEGSFIKSQMKIVPLGVSLLPATGIFKQILQ